MAEISANAAPLKGLLDEVEAKAGNQPFRRAQNQYSPPPEAGNAWYDKE